MAEAVMLKSNSKPWFYDVVSIDLSTADFVTEIGLEETDQLTHYPIPNPLGTTTGTVLIARNEPVVTETASFLFYNVGFTTASGSTNLKCGFRKNTTRFVFGSVNYRAFINEPSNEYVYLVSDASGVGHVYPGKYTCFWWRSLL